MIPQRPDSFNSFIVITFTLVGFHCYPAAPPPVAFLRERHRHLFGFVLHFRVEHDQRQDVVAIGGGLKNRSGDQAFVLAVLHEVRARFPHNAIHLLGVGSPQVLGVASQFGASSADCATAEMNSNFANLMQFAPTDPALINRLSLNESWPVPLQLDKTQLYPKLTATNMFNLELAVMFAINQNFFGGTDV